MLLDQPPDPAACPQLLVRAQDHPAPVPFNPGQHQFPEPVGMPIAEGEPAQGRGRKGDFPFLHAAGRPGAAGPGAAEIDEPDGREAVSLLSHVISNLTPGEAL